MGRSVELVGLEQLGKLAASDRSPQFNFFFYLEEPASLLDRPQAGAV